MLPDFFALIQDFIRLFDGRVDNVKHVLNRQRVIGENQNRLRKGAMLFV